MVCHDVISSLQEIENTGKGKESDPTDVSANTSANASTDTPPTHYRRVGGHTTNTSADTLPTRRPTHYQHVGRHTTNTSADTLPTRRPTHYQHVGRHTIHSSKNLPFLTLTLLRLSVGSKNNVIRKDENMKAKQPPF